MTEQKMSDGAKEARREYSRMWRAQNRDRVREINRRYWERRAQRKKNGGDESVKANS